MSGTTKVNLVIDVNSVDYRRLQSVDATCRVERHYAVSCRDADVLAEKLWALGCGRTKRLIADALYGGILQINGMDVRVVG